MPKIIKLIGKILLILAILALLIGLAYWMVFIRNNPWWLAAAVDSGIIALILAVGAVQRYLMRRREKKFINRIIDQDNARIPVEGGNQFHQIAELQEHWKESVNRLRKSSIRKKGNPLYVLPWYMVFGETGTGKTSAIQNSGLNTPMTELGPTQGIGGTRNCDWYFFEEAIILDTAGRYAIPLEEWIDLEEWKNFLSLLARYRKREPVNGVIIAIAADRLLNDDDEHTRKNGMTIRQRINHMMRMLGAKFPVYVLVTKMDLIYGFDDFSNELKPGVLDQAMGYVNAGKKMFWREVFIDAIKSVSERLSDIRFHLIHKNRKASPMMLFPAEFNRLSTKLENFLESVFAENTYQTTPLLRGIFFSSALRDGQPLSDFLTATSIEPEKSRSRQLPAKGIYLKEFFARILPADRRIYTPLAEYGLWKRITSSLALSAWLLFSLLLAGIISYSYLYSNNLMNDYNSIIKNPQSMSGNIETDLLLMEKLQSSILELDRKNRAWFLQATGFTQSITLQNAAMARYCTFFQKEFVDEFDKDLLHQVDSQDGNHDRQSTADLTGYLVMRLISMQTDYKYDKNFGKPDFVRLASHALRKIHPEVAPEISDMYGSLYYSYISWNLDRPDEEVQASVLRKILINQLEVTKNRDLEWLMMLRELEAFDIRLSSFWPQTGTDSSVDRVILHGGNTLKGREAIKTFIRMIFLSINNPNEEQPGSDVRTAELESRIDSFWGWYNRQFFKSWHDCIFSVKIGTAMLSTSDTWRIVATTMVTEQNPYLKAFDVASTEILAYDSPESRPPWTHKLLYAARIGEISSDIESAQQKSLQGIIAEGNLKGLQISNSALSKKHAAAFADTLRIARAWNEYISTLKGFPVASMSQQQMAEAYSACFSYENSKPEGAQSPFIPLYESLNQVKTEFGLHAPSVSIFQQQNQEEAAVAELLMGPLEYLLLYAGNETSCYLNSEWKESVLGGLPVGSQVKISKALFTPDTGKVWKFTEGPAKPFIANGPEGFIPRFDFMNNDMLFRGEFLNFLDKGSVIALQLQPSYAVTLGTLPSSSNKGVGKQPTSVRLHVACADKPFILENFNYPRSEEFQWNPENCGITTLTINFPEFALTKAYDGELGFARFLNDFRDGVHVFTEDEFPQQAAVLRNNGIKEITIQYTIQGTRQALRLLNAIPERIPASIVDCIAD